MSSAALAVASSIQAVWGLILLALYAHVRSLRERRRSNAADDAAIHPVIEEALAIYLLGGKNLPLLRELARRNPRVMEKSILAFYAVAGASNCENLGDLVLELAIVHGWLADAHSRTVRKKREAFAKLHAVAHHERVMRIAEDAIERGLKDPDNQVRLTAAKALARSTNTMDVTKAFRLAVQGSRKTWVLLTPDLKSAAVRLCETAIPELLSSSDPQSTIRVLDMLASWECALPIENVSALTNHPLVEIRLKTIRLLPRMPVTVQNREAVLQALADQNAEVRSAAKAAAEFLNVRSLSSYGSPSSIEKIAESARSSL